MLRSLLFVWLCHIPLCSSLLGFHVHRLSRTVATTAAATITQSRVFIPALLASGYIPPELDPEYRKIVVRPRATYEYNQSDPKSAEDFTSYPAPKEGDVVQYPGRWNETTLGKIRYLRYIDSYQGFFADIVPLIEGKSDDVFIVDRTASSEFLNVEALVPVRSYFVRAENGNKVYFSKTEPRKVVLKAPRYKKVEKDFTPRTKEINFAQLEMDFRDYEALKRRITISAVQYGAVATVAIAAAVDDNLALDYALGVTAGCFYFYLLGKRVESIGTSYSVLPYKPANATDTKTAATGTSIVTTTTTASTIATAAGSNSNVNSNSNSSDASMVLQQVVPNKFTSTVSKGRLLVPILLLAALAGKGYLLDSYDSNYFHLLPRSVFISAMAGFLTLKLSIFTNEVAQEFKAEDFVGLLPGSVAILFRKLLFDKQNDDEEDVIQRVPPQRVIFVTGPAAAGRAALLSAVMDQVYAAEEVGGKNKPVKGGEPATKKRFRIGRLLTTDEAYKSIAAGDSTSSASISTDSNSISTSDGSSWYQYIAASELSALRKSGEVIFEGTDRDATGRIINVAFTTASYRDSSSSSDVAAATTDDKQQQQKTKKQSKKKRAESEDYVVLLGPPALLNQLIVMDTISTTNIWISVQTKDQFIQQATKMVQKQVLQDMERGEGDSSRLAQVSAEKVSELVNDAAKDIGFYMQKAPLFDYTILNSDSAADNAMAELRQVFINLKN